MSFIGRLFGSNDSEIAKFRPLVERVNAFEPELERLDDAALRGKTAELRARLAAGETIEDLLPEAFAAVREAAKRTIKQRHFDVQLIGGMSLHQGKIAEMKTGEGKTLVASLPLYLNALEGKGVHLVTTNDYLAKTGAGWMAPIYDALGMSASYIAHETSMLYDPAVEIESATDWRHKHWRPITRAEAYRCDITYGQNAEYGFDYLRDNMVVDLQQLVQRGLTYAIVDEVDSILIDEARTPLIISAPAEEAAQTYYNFARIAARLVPGADYIVEEKHRAVSLTEEGISKVEKQLGVKNLYSDNLEQVHYLDNAVKARALYRRDKEYVVKDGKVVIVDEFTGRLMPGRRWSEGLHQAVEAKEQVPIERETKTWATITLQNYFRMYAKLAGMTGTALTDAEEFWKVYKLDVVAIPTHRPMVRADEPDLVYRSVEGKYQAVVEAVKERNSRGQPVLIGTTSVENNERLSTLLNRNGIKHEVLNAKNHEREALIIARAGEKGAVTVATNMAGRGVDILLGEGVADLGGLSVIGTERHEARRIDNQLRGRAGRQGDPGATRFFVSLEDDLMRIFASDFVKGVMGRLGFSDEAPIESKMVSRAIEQAQIKVEGFNFDTRKRTLEYDDVLNKQREVIYGERRKILERADMKETIVGYLQDEVDDLLDERELDNEPESWDLDAILAPIGAMLNIPLERGRWQEIKDAEALKDALHNLVSDTYEARERELGSEVMRAVERWVFLRTVDTLWVDHLTAMEELREGIYLRGYAQRDPLIEYKNESRRMFDDLTTRIETGVAQTILRVTVRTAEQAEQQEKSGGTTQTTPNAPRPQGNSAPQAPPKGRIGRNDPCWCGSGKKYKKCHGR
ncbi:MAG: preprotein translocase subunit SecA [Chloroflexi bacterium 13_1_40CM_4_68_4]|nr:MAG: preprotein translocase subunit SecA [Chloroflexi bacterium 13_1_40CM_4_68_4]